MTFSSLDCAAGQAGRALCPCLPKGEGIIGVAHPDPLHTAYTFAQGNKCVFAMPSSLQYLLPFGLHIYRSLGEEISEISEILWEVDRHQWFLSVFTKIDF